MSPKGVGEWCDGGPGEPGVLAASVALAEGHLDSPHPHPLGCGRTKPSVSVSSFGRRSRVMMASNDCGHVTQVSSLFVPGPPFYAMYELHTYPVTLIRFEEYNGRSRKI